MGKKEGAIIQSLDYQLTEELMNTKSTNSNKNSHKELYRELYKMKINQIWAVGKMYKWNQREKRVKRVEFDI